MMPLDPFLACGFCLLALTIVRLNLAAQAVPQRCEGDLANFADREHGHVRMGVKLGSYIIQRGGNRQGT